MLSHFNSRPSARGDPMHNPLEALQPFQFPPLREGRRKSSAKTPATPYFNSRPSARGDHKDGRTTGRLEISIHAPPRGATDADDADDATLPFQFTPLREGRRFRSGSGGASWNFSIHAPPRGATNPLLPPMRLQIISIHAPPRGATTAESIARFSLLFQFTPLREGRHRTYNNKGGTIIFQFTPLREGRQGRMPARLIH